MNVNLLDENMSSIKQITFNKFSSKRLLCEAIVLSIALCLFTTAFWMTDIDKVVSAFFYSPWQGQDPWPVGKDQFWVFIYGSVTWIVLFWVVLGLVVLFLGFVRREFAGLRRLSLCALLCLALGPGLIVNAGLKEHWGRPRPRQIVEFGGTERYVPPGWFNLSESGKSFPSGHASVGFAFFVFYLMFRHKNRHLAMFFLFFSVFAGSILGYARLAAGGHFLSDILWSMFLSWISGYLSFFIVFILWKPDTVAVSADQDSLFKHVQA